MGADFTTCSIHANPTAFEKIGNRSECLAIIAGLAADGEDEIAQGEVVLGGFKGFFHFVGWVKFFSVGTDNNSK